MNDYIAKNGPKTLIVPTAKTTEGMAIKLLPEIIYLFIKSELV